MTEDAGDGESDTHQGSVEDPTAKSIEELREEVAERYDFEDFTAEDMASISAAEWSAAFDADTWITGSTLLDRIEADLKQRVAQRDLFAVVERPETDRLVVYSDSSYAVVHGSGRVEGAGSILRDVELIVTLCAMEDYEPGEPPLEQPLPNPEDVESGSGRLGHQLIQLIAGAQIIAGFGLLIAPFAITLPKSSTVLVTTTAGLGFLVIGVILFVLVANARLSERFQAQGYRERLEAAGVGSKERPDFVPLDESSERD